MNAVVDVLISLVSICILAALISIVNGFGSVDYTIDKDKVHIKHPPIETDVTKAMIGSASDNANNLLRRYSGLRQMFDLYNSLEYEVKNIEDLSVFCLILGAVVSFCSANRFFSLDLYMNSIISSIMCLAVYIATYLITDKYIVSNLCESYSEDFSSHPTKSPAYDCSASEMEQYILSEADRIEPILNARIYALSYIVNCRKKAHLAQILIIVLSFVFAFLVSQKP